MKPEKRHLLQDLLDEQRAACREATLQAGGRILRRKRWRRRAVLCCGVMALLAIAAFSIERLASSRAPGLTAVPQPASSPQSLTDDELLALFPDTPVGLVTLENGKKRLVFPRPGDQERFVGRL